MNNNREWFLEHKQQYIDTLYEPMKEMGKILFTPFADKPGNVLKVSRIYRDARMHHPLPYKESLWCCIRQDVQYWAEHPCLFFEIAPDGIRYGFSFWHPTVTVMEAFRKEISARPEKFLSLLRDTEAAAEMPVSAECYKRPKACENPELAPYFAWKGKIGCIRMEEVGENMFGPRLADRVLADIEKRIPIYEYFKQFQE